MSSEGQVTYRNRPFDTGFVDRLHGVQLPIVGGFDHLYLSISTTAPAVTRGRKRTTPNRPLPRVDVTLKSACAGSSTLTSFAGTIVSTVLACYSQVAM